MNPELAWAMAKFLGFWICLVAGSRLVKWLFKAWQAAVRR